MESVRRSLRVVKSKPGTEPVAESTPAIEQKKARQLSARKALGDVTNTCDIRLDRPSRTRVARKQADVDELGNQSTLKPEIDPKPPSNAKSKGKAIGTRIVASSSSSLVEELKSKDSTTRGVRLRKTNEQANMVGSRVDSTPIPVATLKDPVVKAARGRKVKEHILGSKAPSLPTAVEVFVTTSVVAPPKDPVVKVVRGRKAKEQVQLESKFGIEHVGDATSIVGIPQGVATGKRTSIGPEPKRKVVQVESKVIKEDTYATKEKVPCNHQKSSSLQQEQGVRAPRFTKGSAEKSTCEGEAHSLRTKRTIRLKKGVIDETSPTNIAESIKSISLKVPKENQGDVHASSTIEGLVTPSQMGVMRRGTPQSAQKRMEAGEEKRTRRTAIKDAQLQAKNDVAVVCEATHVHVEKPLLQRSKKGTGTHTGNKKGASREAVCLPNSKENKCIGGLRSCTDSGHERSTGVLKGLPTESLKNSPVQPACRRNAARGARKPINYAEDDNIATSKISSLLKGTPIMHSDQTARKGGAPSVQQTMRKGIVNHVARADNTSIPSCIANPPSKDLFDGVISLTATIENSLEQGNGQFKLGNLAPENIAKKPPLVATTELVEPMAQTSTKSADSVLLGELSVRTMDVTEQKEEAQTPARKFIRAIRSFKDKVGANPNLHSAQASEQVPHVPKPSLSGDLGAELPFPSTIVQRGQKRGRKEDNVKATGEPARLVTDADVDAKPRCTSSPHVFVNAITASDELDDDSRKFNGAHEHDEQVDANKVDGMAKDDPDWAVFEHEDQVCVNVSGKECNTSLLKPLASFNDADILKKLKDCCKALEKPSPLQAHALPVLLAGRALVAISESDAGHVHAYGAPVLQYAMKKRKSYVRKRPSPLCLVLAASSELAQEITESLQETYGSLRVKIALAVVDSANVPMMETVKPGVAILVTTPKCLQKMLGDGSCSLALVSFIVLDGADCMLDSGQEASLRVIFDEAPPCEQIGVFSSTWESSVEQLVHTFLPNLEIVKIIVHKSVDMQEQLPVEEQVVHQIVEVLEESNKDTRLTALLRTFQKSKKNRVLVYVLYKEEALHVEGLLQQRGWKVASVHGGIFEADRNRAVVSFQKGANSVLVATDVAARGLIIPNVDHVINYSFPYTLDDYARRLRQTGKGGILHTFFLPTNQARAKELVEVLRAAGQDVPEELLHFTSPAKKKPRTEH